MHPEQPGYSVDREAFDRIWFHSVDLLQRGFKSGSILTVDPEDARKLGKPWTRRWGTTFRTLKDSCREGYGGLSIIIKMNHNEQ